MANEQKRDQRLIARVLRGRPGAFDELYMAHVDRIHGQLVGILGPDPDLDDVLQEVILKLFRNLSKYSGRARFSTWLHRLTVNSAIEHLRKRSRRARLETQEGSCAFFDPPDPACGSDETVAAHERLQALDDILSQLSPEKRVVFALYQLQEYRLEEIAEITESSINTVASRLRAARKEVRRAMETRLARERSIAGPRVDVAGGT